MNCDSTYLDLINSFDEPYFEASGSGLIILVNRALRQLVGDTSGKRIYDLFIGGKKDEILEMFSRVISEGQQQKVLLELQPSDSEPLTVCLSLNSLQKLDSDGNHCLRGWMYVVDKYSHSNDGVAEAEQRLKKQADELAILNHLSVATSSSLDLDEILNSICQEMVSVFNARNTGIALLNDSQTGLQVVAFHTEDPDESDATGLEFSLAGNDASLFVIKTGQPIVVPDAQLNPITLSLHEVMVRRGTSCLLVVPLLARGEVIGTIGIPSESQAVFSTEEVRLAQTIAGQVAGVIDNARLYRTVEKARDVAEHELEIGRQIQIGFFPESLPEIAGWELFSYFQSARQVAGDFYDAFSLAQDKKLALVLADVCDKGLGAALFMVLFRSLLRANIQQCFDGGNDSDAAHGEMIVEAVRKTNDYIAKNHAKASMFATVFIAVLSRDQDEVWYINCGHDAPSSYRNVS
ncbi:MAG: SpoIIE family protein phosphatase [Deltaproteobacteria bacterium]|nr:SpoIIE family protein phosphatase [Deltaproteobacteria bacterium]